MKRTALRRKPQHDPVTADLRADVFARDRACILSILEPDTHQCRDAWGMPHVAWDVSRLTIEHVKSESRLGRRAPSDMAHLVTMCYGANVGVPSRAQRDQIRAYLDWVTR